MATLDALPNELLVRVANFLDKRALANVRLLNRRFEQTAVPQLFERVILYAHWVADDGGEGDEDTENTQRNEQSISGAMCSEGLDDGPVTWQMQRLLDAVDRDTPQWAEKKYPGPPGYDAKRFRNILEHDVFGNYVKHVEVYTCETHCDHHPAFAYWWFDGWWVGPEFSPVYEECTDRLGEFPNLNAITLHFDRHAGNGDDEETFQENNFQKQFQDRIFRSLKKPIDSISIRNFHKWGIDNSAQKLRSHLVSVKSLRLSIAHEESHPDGRPSCHSAELHSFWQRFPSDFLQPASGTLTKLFLYTDVRVGWFPKLDLRGIHFPCLRSLMLGNHIFFSQYQVKWIISHSGTLEELNLDHCSILYQAGYAIEDWLDKDYCPRSQNIAEHNHWSYSQFSYNLERQEFLSMLRVPAFSLRWYHVFTLFAVSMHRLRVFRWGKSKHWLMSTTSRWAEPEGGTENRPIMPWEDEYDIKSWDAEDWYVVWNDWTHQYTASFEPDPENSGWDTAILEKYWDIEWLALFDKYPDCDTKDREALQELQRKVEINTIVF